MPIPRHRTPTAKEPANNPICIKPAGSKKYVKIGMCYKKKKNKLVNFKAYLYLLILIFFTSNLKTIIN